MGVPTQVEGSGSRADDCPGSQRHRRRRGRAIQGTHWISDRAICPVQIADRGGTIATRPRMRKRIGSVSLALLVACSGPDSPPQAEPSAAPASPSPSPAVALLDLGQEGSTAGGTRVTVYSVAPSSRNGYSPPSGSTWRIADTRLCASLEQPGQIGVGLVASSQFVAESADGSSYAVDSAGVLSNELMAQPTRLLDPGECIRGLLVFALPARTPVASVVFLAASSPDPGSGLTAAMRWLVPR